MERLTIEAGMRNPLRTTIARRSASVRRTSHIDMAPPQSPAASLVLDGAARDVCTHADGSTTVLADAEVHAVVGPDRTLASIRTTPVEDRARDLLGAPVGRGFRAALDNAVTELRDLNTPLYLLLDELPVAALISGYAHLYSGRIIGGGGERGLQSDICSGWRSDGTMMQAVAEHGRIPVPLGPPTTVLEREGDPHSWHPMRALAIGSMRRQRLLDLGRSDDGADLVAWAMFRDTHVDGDGTESILHEYSIDARLDPATLLVRECRATAHVLPWDECPAAAASATRLVGHPVGEARDLVRRDFHGITTCTHLNDLVRSLGDLEALSRSLP